MGLSHRPRGPLPWRRALETLALTVCLSAWTQPASAQGAAADVINAGVGDTATLPAPVTANVLTYTWYRGTVVTNSQIICTCFVSPPSQVNGPQYTGRETCGPGGSLVIKNLLTNYTGNYTLNVQPNGENPTQATRQLRVYERVSVPVIQAVTQNPVENGSLVLVCNASGTDVSYQWYQDDKLIAYGGRINITKNTKKSQTLTLSPCTRNNSGTSFTCGASNAVSHSTSSQYTLTVSFCLGAWIQPSSAQGADAEVIHARVGQTATLPAPATANILTSAWYRGTVVADPQAICTCFASPPSEFNGPQYTGRETCGPDGSLEIRDLLTNYTGYYKVNVSPSDALPSTVTRHLRVYEPVTKPTVTSEPSQLVENRGPAEITCHTSKAATTILWSFNNSPALPGNILLSPDNRTLSITKVSRGDSGIYQCKAMNPVSSSASDPQTLTVAYGPEHVRIDPPGPLSVQIGTQLSLSCTAGSVPAPRYQWLLNGTDIKRHGNTCIVEKVSSQDSGIYTCVAENKVTGLTANTSVSITVTGNYFRNK